MKIWFSLTIVFIFFNNWVNAQNNYNIFLNENLVLIRDKVDLKKFSIISNKSTVSRVTIEGRLLQRGHNIINFSTPVNLSPGINDISVLINNISFQFGNSAFRHLYNTYGNLPLGNYEYCIKVVENQINGEGLKNESIEECISLSINNEMLLELVDPEDNAKINILYPTLNWIFNSPLISECSYNLNIVEVKNAQSKFDAIQRNLSVFKDNNLRTLSLTYPQYAKSLNVGKKYAWHVNALYNGLLIATTAPWIFEIVSDSINDSIIIPSIYYDINTNNNSYVWDATGILKIKLSLKDAPKDSLVFTLYDSNNKLQNTDAIKPYQAAHGENRIELNFYEYSSLKHNKIYKLNIKGKTIDKNVFFKYLNPELIDHPNEENSIK